MKLNKNRLILIGLFLLSCSNPDNTKDQEIFAELNGQLITIAEVDSIAAGQLYEIRNHTLNAVIAHKVLQKEADKRNISLDLLVNLEIFDKCPIDNLDESVIFALRKERQKQLVDSLIDIDNELKIFMGKPHLYTNELPKCIIPLLTGNLKQANTLVVIFDYDCYACTEQLLEYQNIVNKYSSKLKFVFLPFSFDPDMRIYATIAAGLYNKSIDFINFIVSMNEQFEPEVINEWLIKNSINPNEFELKMNSAKVHSIVDEYYAFLTENDIFTLPSFLLNNRVLPPDVTLVDLENNLNKLK